jgi:hypothetical protein
MPRIAYVGQTVKSAPKRPDIIPRGLAASHLPPMADPDTW